MEQKIAQLREKYSLSNTSSLIWLLTFLISLIFLLPSTTTTTVEAQNGCSNPNSAGCVYQAEYLNATADIGGGMLWGEDADGTATASSNNGAIMAMTELTTDLYVERPASFQVWAQDQIHQITDGQFVAYAQEPDTTFRYFPGLGYTVLRPVNTLWQWARNLTYFFFIIILVVIAFLILFRQSLGGQTIVTLTNSLPSIVFALILVSLSYPLTGLFVDVITVGSNFVQSVMITGPGAPGAEFATNQYFEFEGQFENPDRKDLNYLQPDDPELSIWAIWYTSKSNICEQDDCKASNLIPDVETNNPAFTFVGDIVQGVAQQAEGVVKIVKNPLLNLVLGIAAFSASFKLFMALLKSYVTIIIYAIISPFVFITAAIPNRTTSTIVNFIKTLGAASLSFVAVYALFLLMVIIGRSEDFNEGAFQNIDQLQLAPPLLGYSQDQVGGDSSVIRTLIIFFLFLFSPTIPELIKSLLNVTPTSQYVSQVGQQATGSLKKAASGVMGAASLIK